MRFSTGLIYTAFGCVRILPVCLCYGTIYWSILAATARRQMAPSSSGSGYLVLIQKIAGSNPAGVTKLNYYISENSHQRYGKPSQVVEVFLLFESPLLTGSTIYFSRMV